MTGFRLWFGWVAGRAGFGIEKGKAEVVGVVGVEFRGGLEGRCEELAI
jgi:hypothetical protein